MPKIGRFPPFGKRFFPQARKIIGCCHFAHFWRVLIALAAMNGHRNLRRIAVVGKDHRSRQAIPFFLAKSHWDAPEVLRQRALETLKKLGWRPKPGSLPPGPQAAPVTFPTRGNIIEAQMCCIDEVVLPTHINIDMEGAGL